jgi:enamine deaminase RidA (YjgF/YER057c/UK114 family)
MGIKRYGTGQAGAGGRPLPFARAVEADGWLHVSGQVAMENGVGVWLDDPRDFWTFNKIYGEYFGAHPPARSCVQSSMMVDRKVEIDCVAYKPRGG